MKANHLSKMLFASLIVVPAFANANILSSTYSFAPPGSFFSTTSVGHYSDGSMQDLALSNDSNDLTMVRESPTRQHGRLQGAADMTFSGGGVTNLSVHSFFDIFCDLDSTGTDATGLDSYDLTLDECLITGGNLPGGAMLRESPTLHSTGQTTVRAVSGGFMVSSFFDIFTELSIDGGQTWTPDVDGDGLPESMRLTLGSNTAVPEPASMAALGVGFVALVRRRRLSK